MNESRRLDFGAMLLSGLCLVHCLALPLLLAAVPLGGRAILEDRTFHAVMLFGALPLSAVALAHGWWRHQRWLPPVLGVAGLALMAWDLLPAVGSHGHPWTLPGVVLVTLAHALNLRVLRVQRNPVG